MKIKLSKSQWKMIGRKAGWNSPNMSELNYKIYHATFNALYRLGLGELKELKENRKGETIIEINCGKVTGDTNAGNSQKLTKILLALQDRDVPFTNVSLEDRNGEVVIHVNCEVLMCDTCGKVKIIGQCKDCHDNAMDDGEVATGVQ